MQCVGHIGPRPRGRWPNADERKIQETEERIQTSMHIQGRTAEQRGEQQEVGEGGARRNGGPGLPWDSRPTSRECASGPKVTKSRRAEQEEESAEDKERGGEVARRGEDSLTSSRTSPGVGFTE